MFFFLLTVLIVVPLILFLFHKAGVAYPFSRLLLLALIFCVLATSCLGINYTQSRIPGLQDGIAVSNSLAYFIMGDDRWSHKKFYDYFDAFLVASFVLMVLYILALLWESRKNQSSFKN